LLCLDFYYPYVYILSNTVAHQPAAAAEQRPTVELVAHHQPSVPEKELATLPQQHQWCIVNYDELRYFDQVVNVDVNAGEIQVSSMECMGGNRFKFPARLDKLWYTGTQIVKLASKPKSVTCRIFELYEEDYDCISSEN
jgi:hypothetical protein